jgi:hypothetical protein
VSRFNSAKTSPNGATDDSPGQRPGSNRQEDLKP